MTIEHATDSPRPEALTRREQALLLFFYSPTSGPSRRMEGLVSNLYVRERARLQLRRVDVHASRKAAERFRIRTIPTLVLIKGQRVVAQLEGKVTGQEIRDTVLPHLGA
jgi:thioredoxin-like negative regulator of GroEL